MAPTTASDSHPVPAGRTHLGVLIDYAHGLLFDHAKFPSLAALVIIGDSLLTQLIFRFIRYTEIDWETYMVQVSQFLKGEQDYSKISGPTGPLVYPAGHLYIHQFLYDFTGQGADVASAQQVYAALYAASLIFTCAIYLQAGIPNWVILLLPLSKRLHSIYVLRLFNDCWAAVAVQAAIWAYGRPGSDNLGTLMFSIALSVKMSVLLHVPGLLVILVKRHGVLGAFRHVIGITLVQLIIGSPFLLTNASAYMAGAFDLSRAFLYKWTVNWRFLPEPIFQSRLLAAGLVIAHAGLLLAFAAFRWNRADGGAETVIRRALRRLDLSPALRPVTADQVTTILYTSNLIGILCARSLHYQFYAWYAQQLPFIAWRTKLPTPMKLIILAAIEYAWNVFPSTRLSSGILLASHLTLVGALWFGYPEGLPLSDRVEKKIDVANMVQ